MLRLLLSFVLTLLAVLPASADDALSVTFGDETASFTAEELLKRSDAVTIEIADDVSYHKAMRYRAVPLLALIGPEVAAKFDTLEVRAADGFVSQIPMQLVRRAEEGGSVAWVAVEPPGEPWPALPGKNASAGPFYIVWQHPERSKVGTELWPYQTVAISGMQSPAQRWPQIKVDDGLAADAPERQGQAAFVTQCMPCHRMKGAGAADIGPDLGAPMNPTQYFTPQALRALIRDPKSVRTWPQQQMPGFSEKALPDGDLDAVIAYLAHMASR